MSIYKLTDTLSVSAQIAPGDILYIAEQGFTAVVCNRPDDESPDQASMEAIEAACQNAGLLFVRYPVNAMNFPGQDLEGLGALFDDPSQVVLAYCRSGTRCANLWVATRSEEELPGATETARHVGFDLSMVYQR